jgi:NAD+ synthase
MVDPLFGKFPDMNSFRKGNIMARARMIVLFDQSAAHNGLVVGTGNKTEIILGYTTIYGDSACAFNPLGDLYKTQVRQLAKEMKVPEIIIHKPPSADLWVGQTDEKELGFTYQEVDQLLFFLFDQHMTPADCEREGFSKDTIDRVLTRIRKNAFKRKMPPIARITEGEMKIDI